MNENMNPMFDSPIVGYAYHRIILDDTGRPCDYEFLAVNATFTKLTGIPKDNLIGRTARQAIPGIEKSKFDWIGCYGDIALHGGEKQLEQFSEHLGRWYRVHVSSTKKPFFSTTFIDITEQKRQTEELAGFFSVNLDLLCIVDLEGNFLKTNEAWGQLFGYSTEELCNRKFLDFVHPDDIPSTCDAMAMLQSSQNVLQCTNRYRCKDGSYRYIEWRSRLQGNRIYGAARDITERIQAEQALKESEANYRAFFDAMADMVVVTSPQGRVLYANVSMLDKLGYDLEELNAVGVLGIHPVEHRTEAEEIFAAMIRGERTTCPLPVQRKNGEWVPVETRAFFGKWNGGDCLFGVLKDLSKEQEALQKFDKLFDLHPSMMALTLLPYRRYIEINKAFLATLGMTREQVVGKTALELEIMVDSDAMRQSREILQRDGRIRNMELQFQTSNGELRDGLLSGDIIDVQGKKYLLSTMLDITEQKQTQKTLQAERDQLLSLFDSIDESIYIADPHTHELLYINHHFATTFPKAEIGKKCYKILQGRDAPCPFCTNEIIFQKKNKPYRWEHYNPITDRHYALIDRVIQWSDGRDVRFELAIDITDRKKAEALIMAQSALQQTLMDIANAFINVPLEQTESIINESLARLGQFTNVDRAYVFSYDFDANTCSNTHEWCRDGIEPQLDELQHVPLEIIPEWVTSHRNGQAMYIPDVSTLPPDNGVRKVLEPQGVQSVMALPMMDGGQCIGFVGFDAVREQHHFSNKEQVLLQLFAMMLVNLSHRNQMHSQLVQAVQDARDASKAKSEFLANMSHEIRTPLNGIIGFTDLLKKTQPSPLQKQYIDSANVSGHALLGIINDILDFSKIEAGMMSLEIIKTDMIELLENSIDIVKYAASEKKLEILLDIDETMPRFAWVDPVRLKQILANLLSNAIKFTDQGEVELCAAYTPLEGNQGRFHISVLDTGIGITEEQKEKLFKAFSQADSSTTRKFGGTGLGLIISDMIAKKMGSKIHFDSTLGKGSTFYLDFVTDTENIVESGTAPQMVRTGPERECGPPTLADMSCCSILIAEDVSMNMIVIKGLVQMTYPSIQILEASDGLAAIEQYNKEHPDLILMDIQMPELDGLDTTKRIRALETHTGKHVPIVALTAGAFEEEKARCLAAGMDAFLTKPIDLAKLTTVLQQFLTQSCPPPKVVHFEREKLVERCGEATALTVMQYMAVHIPAQLAALGAALAADDMDNIQIQAHTLKGISLNGELPAMASISSNMESISKKKDMEESECFALLQQRFQELQHEWVLVEEELLRTTNPQPSSQPIS